MGRMKTRPGGRRERYELETGESFSATEQVSFTCPFCGGTVTVGEHETDGKKSGNHVVLHTMPPCQKYIDEDPLVFIRNARVAVVGPLPDDDEHPVPVVRDGGRNDN